MYPVRPITSAAIVLLAGFGLSCQQPQPPAGKSVAGEKVIWKLDAPGGMAATLIAGPGEGTSKSLAVSIEGSSGTVPLPMTAYVDEFHEASEPFLAGDPMNPVEVKAQESGKDEKSVVTAVRPVRASSRQCVLAEQEFGFEVVKRNHVLICAQNKKTTSIWKHEEGEGPTWSSVDIRDLDGDGTDELVVYKGFRAPQGAETLDATAWKWSGAELKEEPVTGLKTVVAGVYPSEAAARKARDEAGKKNIECSRAFWVLSADKGRFQLASKTLAGDIEGLPGYKSWTACFVRIQVQK